MRDEYGGDVDSILDFPRFDLGPFVCMKSSIPRNPNKLLCNVISAGKKRKTQKFSTRCTISMFGGRRVFIANKVKKLAIFFCVNVNL